MDTQTIPIPDKSTEDVRAGQKTILYAILMNLTAFALSYLGLAGPITSILFLCGIGFSMYGMFLMSGGLGFQTALKVIFCILLIVPLVSLVVLLVLNSKATAHLRKNGFKVGLMGANKKSA